MRNELTALCSLRVHSPTEDRDTAKIAGPLLIRMHEYSCECVCVCVCVCVAVCIVRTHDCIPVYE